MFMVISLLNHEIKGNSVIGPANQDIIMLLILLLSSKTTSNSATENVIPK